MSISRAERNGPLCYAFICEAMNPRILMIISGKTSVYRVNLTHYKRPHVFDMWNRVLKIIKPYNFGFSRVIAPLT